MIAVVSYLTFLYVYPLILTVAAYALLLVLSAGAAFRDRYATIVMLFTVFYVSGSLAIINWKSHVQTPIRTGSILLVVALLSMAGYELVKRTMSTVRSYADSIIIGALGVLVASILIKARVSSPLTETHRLDGDITSWKCARMV